MQYNKIVVKVGTSTLTHDAGTLNLRRIELLARRLSDIKHAGVTPVLVTSGAVGVGNAKLGVSKLGQSTRERQAAAAIGQVELMYIYSRFFADYGVTVAQTLLTKDTVDNAESLLNITNTLSTLTDYGVIPIINENDAVAVDEIKYGENGRFGDNDTLSAYVATIVNAELLLILTDVEGLYDGDPQNLNSRLIPRIDEINDDVRALGGGSGTSRGTGGMASKLKAAEIATSAGITTIVASGVNPDIIYDVVEGKPRGTLFAPRTV